MTDYERLVDVIGRAEQVLVTPNTLTEASNLLGQHGEPERSRLMDGLRYVIEESRETVVASADAAGSKKGWLWPVAIVTVFERAAVTSQAPTLVQQRLPAFSQFVLNQGVALARQLHH